MSTLRELREGKYLSRKALAKLAGVSESTIVRMEEGKQHTKEEVANQVLQALSNELGHEVTINTVEGLNLYNIMRDRRHRRKEPEKKKENV
jgi:transcriptional regulator with XRE-family HTH domain